MRSLGFILAMATITACTTTQDAEIAATQRSNAASATADAANISRETDPDARAAQCVVFLGISRHHKSRAVGFGDAAMARAQAQWRADLRTRLDQVQTDQLTGSSVNMLEPAAAAQRDAASRWCVQNAPGARPAN